MTAARSLALSVALAASACMPSAETPSASPSASATRSPAPSATVASPSPSGTSVFPGAITGRLAYPSDFIPPLRVYAVAANADLRYRIVHTAQNQSSYVLAGVHPGTYFVYAYAYTLATPSPRGGYTYAIPCGLRAGCNDHTPLPVTVGPGQTVKGVDVIDWYAPPGTMPDSPTGQEPFASGDRLTVQNPLADDVNVRTSPGLDGRVVGTLTNGAALEVADGPRTADGYDWYFVRSGTLSGWAVGYALRR